jgi:hypothetical protein
MKLSDVGDVLTMGILDGASISTYDYDSTLYVLNWQSFQKKGEQERKALDRYFFFGLTAARFSEEQLDSIQPFVLLGLDDKTGEIYTGLYDMAKKEIKTIYLLCTNEDVDWGNFYGFFK